MNEKPVGLSYFLGLDKPMENEEQVSKKDGIEWEQWRAECERIKRSARNHATEGGLTERQVDMVVALHTMWWPPSPDDIAASAAREPAPPPPKPLPDMSISEMVEWLRVRFTQCYDFACDMRAAENSYEDDYGTSEEPYKVTKDSITAHFEKMASEVGEYNVERAAWKGKLPTEVANALEKAELAFIVDVLGYDAYDVKNFIKTRECGTSDWEYFEALEE